MPLYTIVMLVILGIAYAVARSVFGLANGLRASQWFTADSEFVSIEDNNLPPDATRMIDDLENVGFVVRGQWQPTVQFSNAQSAQVTFLEHPRTFDVAKVVFTVNRNRRDVVVLFQTLFDDGTEVAMANNQLPTGLPTQPGITGFWLPAIRDARQLYFIHDQVRDSLGLGKKRLPVGQDPVAFLGATANRVNIYRVRIGYYFLDEAEHVYRLTWKGALLMTCRLLRPTALFYRAWRRRQTRNRLRKLGVRLDFD